MKGFDVTTHALACFGGAGPQFCCAMAKTLGIKRILVNRFSGILSAYGIHLADIVVEKQEASPTVSSENSAASEIKQRLQKRLEFGQKVQNELSSIKSFLVQKCIDA